MNHDVDGTKITLIGLFTNLFLAIIKFLAGTWGQSQVLIADAAHSLSDLLSDFIVLIGIKYSRKPQDECHQFGHGKFETLASLSIAVFLIFVAYGIGRSAIEVLYSKEYFVPNYLPLLAAILSIIIKEALFQFTYRQGVKIKSEILKVNAWHHRTDALSSLAALIGVAGAMFGYPILDAIAALVVAVFILKVGIDFGRKALDELLERAVPSELQNNIAEAAMNCSGVKSYHRLRTRKVGPQVFVDIHIQVDPSLTVLQGHEIAGCVKHSIIRAINAPIDVMVHIEPDT
jgi:cation diffusion facilitator family transporter